MNVFAKCCNRELKPFNVARPTSHEQRSILQCSECGNEFLYLQQLSALPKSIKRPYVRRLRVVS